ncbi:MAG TPA: TolC family protein [Candidatus Manganitrophaceae bacterium]|nr:TolC family protein [Candidatus Manganitrophaceae bacterium]
MRDRTITLKAPLLQMIALLAVMTSVRELSAGEGAPVEWTLQGAIRIALQNNVDARVETENVSLREALIGQEIGQFDPTLRLEARSDRSVRGSTSLVETGFTAASRFEQENQRIDAGLQQRFRWGGNYDLSLGQVRSSATLQEINPTLRGTALLTFTQPLLRGFGREAAEGPLRIARSDYAISQSAFKSAVMAVILEVSQTYWDLVFHRENVKIQRQTLQAAQQLLEVNRAKVGLGLLAPIEILVAESGVASREEGVVIAEKGVRDTEDQLRRLLNFPEQSATEAPEILPVDPPEENEKTFDEKTLLETALNRRPEIEQNRLQLENRALAIRIAQNQLFPSLDLVGSVGRNGLGGNYSDEIDQLRSGDFYQWEAGLVLTFPLGNRAAKAALQKEQAEWNRAALAREKVRQQVALETKEGLRRVRTDFQRIATTRRARALAEKKLSAGNERFNLGLISSHDLLEFQNESADARGKELKAVTDYNKSLANLEKVTGLLSDRYPISATPEAPR